MKDLTAAQVARFWAKVEKTETCWLWTAYIQPTGYGQFVISGKTHMAHRLSYELCVGPIPDGLALDHVAPRCTSRRCVNPDHLEPVTTAENNYRVTVQRTHCVRGHLLPPAAPGLHRRCSECKWEPRTPDQIPDGMEHGTTTYNFYRCRCDICRAANAARSLAYYYRKRAAAQVG